MRTAGAAPSHFVPPMTRSRTWDTDEAPTPRHVPVLLDEALGFLRPAQGGLFIDATIGLGGHAHALLKAGQRVDLLGIDRDAEALAHANLRLAEFRGRYHLVQANFSEVAAIAAQRGVQDCQGILADLGASSLQFDSAERGFSFQLAGPLDMRMDRGAELTAAEIVNHYSEKDLANLIFTYGEEPRSRSIARAIVHARPIQSTKILAEVIHRAVPARGYRRIHPATRTFQALRIFVNDELGCLRAFIRAAAELLSGGGRLVIIGFHSLEDRIVKETFRALSRECACPVGILPCRCGQRRLLSVLTKKPVVSSEAELKQNPRARSAKLRAAERL